MQPQQQQCPATPRLPPPLCRRRRLPPQHSQHIFERWRLGLMGDPATAAFCAHLIPAGSPHHLHDAPPLLSSVRAWSSGGRLAPRDRSGNGVFRALDPRVPRWVRRIRSSHPCRPGYPRLPPTCSARRPACRAGAAGQPGRAFSVHTQQLNTVSTCIHTFPKA